MTDTLAAVTLAVALVAPPQVMTPPMVEAQTAHDAQLRLDELAALQCGPEGTIHECLPDPPATAPHRHPPAAPAPVSPPPVDTVGSVEQWRGLVAQYVPTARVEEVLRVMACESGGDPNAYNPSSATGLMQIKRFWVDPSRPGNFSHLGTDLYDPVTNLRVMVAINESDPRGWWGHWACKP